MKTVLILLAVVLVVGGGIWYAMETDQDSEVFDQEEVADRDFVEIEMSDEEFMEVLSGAMDISSLSYRVEMQSPQGDMEGSFWQKGGKIRMEGEVMGEETLVIIDNEERVAYTYLPAQDMAMEMSMGEVEDVQEGSLQGQAEQLPEHNPVVIGEEFLDGKECLVVEYDAGADTGKMWIWKEHGLPIKLEVGGMVVRAFDIDFGDVPDNKFQLPEGVEPTEIPTDIPLDVPEELIDDIPEELPEGIF